MTTFELKQGEPTTLNFNRPVKFKIQFVMGTYIEGVIPPNSDFTVCNRGDIAEFSVIIDDDTMKEISLVEAPADFQE
tara:strand:- start:5720 stop:5950 length:231 start_codon:yes stop_codon:yes gene_type:complete